MDILVPILEFVTQITSDIIVSVLSASLVALATFKKIGSANSQLNSALFKKTNLRALTFV